VAEEASTKAMVVVVAVVMEMVQLWKCLTLCSCVDSLKISLKKL